MDFTRTKMSCVFRSINFRWISTRLWNVINFPLPGVNAHLIPAFLDIFPSINHKISIFYARHCDENHFSFKTFAFYSEAGQILPTNSPFEISAVYLSPDFPPQSQRSSFYCDHMRMDVSERLWHMLDKEKRYISMGDERHTKLVLC